MRVHAVTDVVTGGLARCSGDQDRVPGDPASGKPTGIRTRPPGPTLSHANPTPKNMDPVEMSLKTARFYKEEADRLLAAIRSESTYAGKLRLLRDIHHAKARMDYEIRIMERMMEAGGDDDPDPGGPE